MEQLKQDQTVCRLLLMVPFFHELLFSTYIKYLTSPFTFPNSYNYNSKEIFTSRTTCKGYTPVLFLMTRISEIEFVKILKID